MNTFSLSYIINASQYEVELYKTDILGLPDSYFEDFVETYENSVDLRERIKEAIRDNTATNFMIFETLLFSFIFILGLFGNVTICFIILKNVTMRNTTNYFLFNLAVSDLMSLIIGIIIILRDTWNEFPWSWGLSFCKILHYAHSVGYNVSVLTILAFSVEHYFSICHPLHFNTMKELIRHIGFIIFLWIIGFILSSVELLRIIIKAVFQLPSGLVIDPEMLYCDLKDNLLYFKNVYLHFVLMFLLPMVVVIVLYKKMGRKLRTSFKELQLNSGENNNSYIRQLQSKRETMKTLRLVVITSFICWTPYSFYSLFMHIESMEFLISLNFKCISLILLFTSCAKNPIIYIKMSALYRKAFKESFSGEKRLCQNEDVEQNTIKESSI